MISVVIAHHRGRCLLKECLQALAASEDVDLEITVVDNGSSDGSREMVRQSWPSVRLVELDHNSGFAAANNLGIRLSHGDAVVLLNNDVVVDCNALASLWEFARRTPHVAALVPRLRNPDGSIQRSHYEWPSVAKSLLHLAGADSLLRNVASSRVKEPDSCSSRESVEIRVAKFACVLLTRESLVKVGLLDEDFFMYGEDADWSRRAYEAGFRSYIVPGAGAVHFSPPRVFDTSHPMFVSQHLGALIYHRKHSPRWAFRLLLVGAMVIVRMRLVIAAGLGLDSAKQLLALGCEIERLFQDRGARDSRALSSTANVRR